MPAAQGDTGGQAGAIAWQAELGGGERVLLRATRRVAFGGAGSCSAEAEFVAVCGAEAGPTVWVAFRAFLVLLALYGRRSLVLAPPGWPHATPDEARLLQLFAAAQAGATARVAAHLAWLLRPQCTGNAPAMVGHVADTLAAAGVRIRLAPDRRPDRRQGRHVRPRTVGGPAEPTGERRARRKPGARPCGRET